MLGAFLSVLAMGLIGAGLAAVIVLAETLLRNYGNCEIVINEGRSLKVQGGLSLLEGLAQNRVFVPSACGGRGTCAFCKVTVLEGAGPLAPTEEPYLDARERAAGVRLACQVRVKNALRIRLPESLLAVREYACVCRRIRNLSRDIKEFRFELVDPPAMAYVPGQYMQLLSPAYDGNEEVYRAYSVSSDPADKSALELVIRLVPGGICTTWCFQHLAEGGAVRMNGPYGDFRLSDTDAPMLFVAGGSGLAPMKCFLHHLQNTGSRRPVTFFFGANRVDELIYLERMREFEKALPDFRFVPVVAQPEPGAAWTGETGLVTEALKRAVADASGHEAYLCGSPGMIQASIKVLRSLGMPESHIRYDKFE